MDCSDVQVNNAGIGSSGPLADGDLAALDRVFETNVRAVVHLTSLCIPHLENTKGCVLNVSSEAGIRPVRLGDFLPKHIFSLQLVFLSYYNLTKAALDQYTRCLAYELAPRGIRVNSIK